MPKAATRSAGWTTVAFGDVVRLSKERSSDPEADGFERFVGLDHIEPGDLRIRRWGDVADGTTFTSVFRPGQVLFGKRRAYQRKVAVADFSGVCSGDIYVLEPKGKDLLPELLPFICQTDAFFEHAVGTSAGTLSPRTNWESLATFEFHLPRRVEQLRMAEILLATECHNNALRALEVIGAELLQSSLSHEFSSHVESAPLSAWCEHLITYGIVQAGPDTPDGVPYIRVSDMTSGPTLSLNGMLRTTPEIAAKFGRSRVSAGDIVVALRGPVGLPRVVPPELEGANLTQGTARLAVKPEHCTDYVVWALQSPLTLRQYASVAKGSTFSEISLEALRRIELPVRVLPEQKAIAARLQEIATGNQSVTARRQRASAVYYALLNGMLGAVK